MGFLIWWRMNCKVLILMCFSLLVSLACVLSDCLNGYCRKFWFFFYLVEIELESFDFDVFHGWWVLCSVSNDYCRKFEVFPNGFLDLVEIVLESFDFDVVHGWWKDSNLLHLNGFFFVRSPWKCGSMCAVWKQCREAWVCSWNVFESLLDVFGVVLCRQLSIWMELPCSMVLLF